MLFQPGFSTAFFNIRVLGYLSLNRQSHCLNVPTGPLMSQDLESIFWPRNYWHSQQTSTKYLLVLNGKHESWVDLSGLYQAKVIWGWDHRKVVVCVFFFVGKVLVRCGTLVISIPSSTRCRKNASCTVWHGMANIFFWHNHFKESLRLICQKRDLQVQHLPGIL